MSSKSEIQLHLSVWRPAPLDRNYLYNSQSDNHADVFSPIDDTRILEQIYTWDSGPNGLLDTSTPALGRQIKQGLIDNFTSDRPPSERNVHHFYEIVNSILNDTEVQSNTYWSDCQETIKDDTFDEINVRADVTLAVLRHFHWVACVFLEVPRASVLIR